VIPEDNSAFGLPGASACLSLAFPEQKAEQIHPDLNYLQYLWKRIRESMKASNLEINPTQQPETGAKIISEQPEACLPFGEKRPGIGQLEFEQYRIYEPGDDPKR